MLKLDRYPLINSPLPTHRGFLGIVILSLCVAFVPAVLASGGGGGGGFDASGVSGDADRGPTPEQKAQRAYNKGLKYRKDALKYEDKATAATEDKDREKQQKYAKEAWDDAIAQYKKAIGYDATLYQAMNELGYALRKSGDYKGAIEAYNKALGLQSDYAPAIEYRGEAFLLMQSFADVKDAYVRLVKLDHDQATLLLTAIKQWLAAHADVSTDEAKAFAQWVAERNDLAQLLPGSAHAWAP